MLGLSTAAFLRAKGHPARRYVLFLWFAVMELIQYAVSMDTAMQSAILAAKQQHVASIRLPRAAALRRTGYTAAALLTVKTTDVLVDVQHFLC